jgi:hypothetical protein
MVLTAWKTTEAVSGLDEFDSRCPVGSTYVLYPSASENSFRYSFEQSEADSGLSSYHGPSSRHVATSYFYRGKSLPRFLANASNVCLIKKDHEPCRRPRVGKAGPIGA